LRDVFKKWKRGLFERSGTASRIFAANRTQLRDILEQRTLQWRDILKKRKRGRLARFNIVFPILLAGWVPSVLTLVVSYTILSRTLESKILRDRQTFVQLIGHLVGDDLAAKSALVEYYQTLPDVAKTLTNPKAATLGQQWLNEVFFSHPRVDGMFITDAEGRLIASLPSNPNLAGHDFGS
jgi:hypothetical protein